MAIEHGLRLHLDALSSFPTSHQASPPPPAARLSLAPSALAAPAQAVTATHGAPSSRDSRARTPSFLRVSASGGRARAHYCLQHWHSAQSLSQVNEVALNKNKNGQVADSGNRVTNRQLWFCATKRSGGRPQTPVCARRAAPSGRAGVSAGLGRGRAAPSVTCSGEPPAPAPPGFAATALTLPVFQSRPSHDSPSSFTAGAWEMTPDHLARAAKH